MSSIHKRAGDKGKSNLGYFIYDRSVFIKKKGLREQKIRTDFGFILFLLIENT